MRCIFELGIYSGEDEMTLIIMRAVLGVLYVGVAGCVTVLRIAVLLEDLEEIK